MNIERIKSEIELHHNTLHNSSLELYAFLDTLEEPKSNRAHLRFRKSLRQLRSKVNNQTKDVNKLINDTIKISLENQKFLNDRSKISNTAAVNEL